MAKSSGYNIEQIVARPSGQGVPNAMGGIQVTRQAGTAFNQTYGFRQLPQIRQVSPTLGMGFGEAQMIHGRTGIMVSDAIGNFAEAIEKQDRTNQKAMLSSSIHKFDALVKEYGAIEDSENRRKLGLQINEQYKKLTDSLNDPALKQMAVDSRAGHASEMRVHDSLGQSKAKVKDALVLMHEKF